MRWAPSILAAVLLAGACATATREQLTKRAAFDLDCAESNIEIHELDNRTRGVKGCGKRATYVETCDQNQHGRYNCTWVLNADVHGTDEDRRNPELPEQTVEP